MTTYRLLDGASGRPGVGSSGTTPPGVTGYSGPFQAGTLFSVTTGGMWLQGYWWWCPSGGDTGSQEFCLWQRNSSSTEVLVPGSTVTSGTLTSGSFNYVPLATPIQLAIGTLYVACTGWSAVNGFPDSQHQFGSGDPYAGGITSGPLVAWADSTNGGGLEPAGGTNNLPQGIFGVSNNGGTPDPATAGNMPASSSNSSLFWVDAEVSDTAPPGYTGSYRIWPAKYDGQATSGVDTAANYILGTEFTLSQACTLDAIWFYSPPTATQLPTQCAIWDVTTQTMAGGTLQTSPSWSGAAGSGWVSCAYSGVTLPAGDYKTSVWNGTASPSGFNQYTIGYFVSGGAAASGIASGPVTVPDAAAATSPGQSTYQTSGSTFLYPDQYVAAEGQSYWVDVEVTPALITAGAAALSGSGSMAGQVTLGYAAPLGGRGSLSVAGETLGYSAILAGSGTLSEQVILGYAAALSGTGAAGESVMLGYAAALAGDGSLAVPGVTLGYAASLAGSGTLGAAVLLGYPAALSGSDVLTVPGVVLGYAAAPAASGALAVSGAVLGYAASLSGTGTLTASAAISGQFAGTANLAGQGTLGPGVTLGYAAALAGTGSFAGSWILGPSAVLSGTGLLSGSWLLGVAAQLAGQGALSGAAAGRRSGAAVLAGLGVLTASGRLVTPVPFTGTWHASPLDPRWHAVPLAGRWQAVPLG